ncbi:MAG: phosphoribosyltransferase family protein [Cyclobacteriaceae bacterium]
MSTDENLVLNDVQIRQKIRRIAYEIYENNYDEKELIVAGIVDHGYELARLIADVLEEISPLKVKLIHIDLDKLAPTQSEIVLDCETDSLKNKVIILVDDVLNTGRTLAYSLKPFLKIKVKRLEIAVLVNRSHTQFPMSSKYTGYELATTINEHVKVDLKGKKFSVILQ